MQNKFFFILILVLSFGLSNILAQIQTVAPAKLPVVEGKAISGGVLNGKAVTLTKPSYPAAAQAVRASGAVNVQVTIDENGDVISASAVSGHPLLRQAAEQAARTSKFSPTKLEGQAVKVTGVIVYNFVAAMTMTQIGYELSLAENSKSIGKSQISSISGTIPPSWEKEKEALKKLNTRLTDKVTKDKIPETPTASNVNADKPVPPNANVRGITFGGIATRIGTNGFGESYSVDADSIAIIKELQSDLANRLSVRENILWSFKLGGILGKLKADLESDEKTRANISELSLFSANIPSGISESAAAKIKEFVKTSQQTTSEMERKEKLTMLIENLRNLKVY